MTGEHHDFSKMAERLVQFCDEALKEVSKSVILCREIISSFSIYFTLEILQGLAQKNLSLSYVNFLI